MENLTVYVLLIGVGLFLRASLSLHPYSGQSKPPKFGDYEAQRHWQEITVNLPIRSWYENSTKNDLNYWGLDYPPLTSYHSWILGKTAQAIDSSFIKLFTSRGITNERHKLFMRCSVIVVDAVLYIPALISVCVAAKSRKISFLHMIVCITYPGQMLIDNGHFQYNNISLGLFALAVAAILNGCHVRASILFSLALNYKQMELYHALPFFFFLLGTSVKQGYLKGSVSLAKIGLSVIVTFLLLWSPWLGSKTHLLQILHRIFPIYRGVFEDKVASIWCIVNVAFKIKSEFGHKQMAMICLTCTVAAMIPICVHLFLKPCKKVFQYSLLNSSLIFFLFSFHVHEKSILLAAIPAAILFPVEPFACYWFLQMSTFSMLPLFLKDGLLLAYIALQITYFLGIKLVTALSSITAKEMIKVDILNVGQIIDLHRDISSDTKTHRVYFYLSIYFGFILIMLQMLAEPPKSLPFLWPLLISAYSCLHFIMFLIYFAYKQLQCSENE